jgi:alpha-galactosidase
MLKTFYSVAVFLLLSFSSNSQQPFSITGNNIVLNYDFYHGKNLRLRTILPALYKQQIPLDSLDENLDAETFLHITGEDRNVHHGAKLTGASASARLAFVEKQENNLPDGRQIIFIQHDAVKNLQVASYYEFNNFSPVIRRYTIVTNQGTEPVGIDYLSSAMLHNFGNIAKGTPQQNLRIHYANSSWMQESQWKTQTPTQMGWSNNGAYSLNGIFFSNVGSWSTIKYLPMAMVENTKAGITWFWQIEHNGSWHWEMSNNSSDYSLQSTYLYIGGPDEEHHHAWKNLLPGQSYKTITVALGCVQGGFEKAVEALTIYRRKVLLRSSDDNTYCPVIFNDYMNCLGGNPTTEKELPLINAAAKAGCDYYVIDAGWYAEINEPWWTAVGLWQPSKTRFPDGLPNLLTVIKQHNMKPGLWLEVEVAGINSPLKDKPDAWFMMRHGKRVIDHGRYLLDFRNPEVIAHANEVVDRLVEQYGASYIKMDYNVNALMGTEINAESFGQGLLEHNRAVINWYKNIRNRHPDLVVENCGSGGCRMDYAMLSQTQLQSSSDQDNYKKYPAILTGTMAAVLPEQLAVWSYPSSAGNAKEAAFNMVNAMLCRIHQSGNLATLPPQSFSEVVNAIKIYKQKLAPFIPKAIPFFPLGMPNIDDTLAPVAVGLKKGDKAYIAVWRLGGSGMVTIPGGTNKNMQLIYPNDLGIHVFKKGTNIQLLFPDKYMAAIIEITK